MNQLVDRIRTEAAFQDSRTLSARAEPREKYYFLAKRAMARYRAAMGDVAGRRVLVVGCAVGGVTPLARMGANVVGIDISVEAIRKLEAAIVREGLRNRAQALEMNAEALTFPRDSFDLICCTGVLHHLNIEPAAKAWADALAHDGSVVMLEPMSWNPSVALYRWMTPAARTADEHPLKPTDIRLLERFFRKVEIEGFVLTSCFAALWAFFPMFEFAKTPTTRLLESIDDRLLKVIPALTYCCWTAVIRCSQPVRQ